MNKKVCLYCRVTRNEQNNLNLQIENLKNFTKQKGLEIFKIVSETGGSLDFKRKGLTEISKAAKSKQVDVILMKDLSRISRDTVYSLNFIENIKNYVEFKTADFFDISDNDWNSTLSMLSKFFGRIKKEQIVCTIYFCYLYQIT